MPRLFPDNIDGSIDRADFPSILTHPFDLTLYQCDIYDALVVYLTGAASDAASQSDPDLSIGSYCSSNRADGLGFIAEPSIPYLNINYISGQNGIGLGSIEAIDGLWLRWTAPDSTPGEMVKPAFNMPIKLTDGSDPDKYIIVTLTADVTMTGITTVKLVKKYNNVIGFSNITSSQRTAGVNRLRCIALKNKSSDTLEDVKVYIKTLADQVVSDAGQLSASGAGTITTTGTFNNWPQCGWCRISTSADVEKEIVYYTSRTSTVLTIAAAGRARLGTSAAAGAATDKLDCVPGIKIAAENPSPAFTVISSQTDTASVSALTFHTPISASGGLDCGDLLENEMIGIWIWCETFAGQNAAACLENAIGWQYNVGAVTIDNCGTGYYRIANTALDRYELFHGLNQIPDFQADPDETFNSLPASITRFQTVISDGDFSENPGPWTAGANWSIIHALQDMAYCSDADSAGTLSQSPSIEAGIEYELTFTIEITGTISITPTVGAAAGTARSVSGTFTEIITTTDTTGISFSVSGPAASGTITITNVVLSKRRSGTHYFSLRKRNAYDLISQNNEVFKLTLDSNAEESIPNPDDPISVIIIATSNAAAAIEAVYVVDKDESYPATHWLIYSTDDGSDPDPAIDTPDSVAMVINNGVATLSHTTDAADHGDTIKAIIKTAVIDGEDVYKSSNCDIYSIAAVSSPPAAVTGNMFFGNNSEVIL